MQSQSKVTLSLQNGMTLIELSVVLMILTILAGLTVPYVVGTNDLATCQATDASLYAVKQAIMGGPANTGYYMDTLGKYPQDLQDLSQNTTPEYGLYYLFSSTNLPVSPTRSHLPYKATTGVGWRGPYLTNGAMLTQASLSALDLSFGSVFNLTTLSTPTFVHFNIVGHAQATAIPHVLDAWGRPIILQIPYDTNPANPKNGYQYDYARLVSAGPTLKQAAIDTKIQYDSSFIDSNGVPHPLPDAYDRNNDRVLYLKMPDPLAEGNQPCNQ